MNGTQIKEVRSKYMSLARCAIFCTGGCESATFSRILNRCVTFKEKIIESSIKRTMDAHWYVIYKNGPAEFDDWTIPVECLQLTYSNTCTRHFRSFILDQWVNIDKVKLSLYNDGVEMKYILFDGRGPSWYSWFEQSRILNSSWTNIISDPNIKDFSIDGLDDGYSIHRFSIYGPYNGCDMETTYLFALDIFQDACSPEWPMTITSFPKIIYSPGDNMAPMHGSPTAYRYADVMAILVKFTSP
ncbi:unnamed protein product [Lymnaea stagnalis]|uniref:Uncharacterized protein n=1 Tax=Lymnaea stagnalis TaxID=6523 RepID=A0AAV2HQZ6_LYMST